jgi:hypothetical protein
MIFTVFLIGSVSAFEKVTFDEEVGNYGKITIEERKLYDPFGWIFDKNIIEKELKVNTDRC